jgi:hypothetical protein
VARRRGLGDVTSPTSEHRQQKDDIIPKLFRVVTRVFGDVTSLTNEHRGAKMTSLWQTYAVRYCKSWIMVHRQQKGDVILEATLGLALPQKQKKR